MQLQRTERAVHAREHGTGRCRHVRGSLAERFEPSRDHLDCLPVGLGELKVTKLTIEAVDIRVDGSLVPKGAT